VLGGGGGLAVGRWRHHLVRGRQAGPKGVGYQRRAERKRTTTRESESKRTLLDTWRVAAELHALRARGRLRPRAVLFKNIFLMSTSPGPGAAEPHCPFRSSSLATSSRTGALAPFKFSAEVLINPASRISIKFKCTTSFNCVV
jgi:hypothetical protein